MKCFVSLHKVLLLCFALPACSLLSCSENKTRGNARITSNPDSLEGKQVYLNPADGKAYSSEGVFKTYGPDGDVPPKYGPAVLQKIVLLTDEQTLAQVISIDTLDRYFSSDSSTLATVFKDYKKQGDLLIQFTLYARKQPEIIVSYDGNFDTTILRQLNNQLNRNCSYYRVRKDSCIYQALYHTGTPAPASKQGTARKADQH